MVPSAAADPSFWSLAPEVVHLNHGSFGATPRPVTAARNAWQARLEENPVRFMDEDLGPAALSAINAVAGFVGAEPDGVAFVPNATTGVNATLRSLEPMLRPGDEILVTDHGYNACTNAVHAAAQRTGAAVVVAEVPFPITEPSQVTSAILRACTSRTAVAVLDHVSSSTAVVFPVAEIVAELEPDVAVIIDGAHSPGMLPLQVDDLGASFYTGNCHKWMCGPKGAGFLVTRPDRRETTLPVVISHAWNRDWPPMSRYQALFAWTGTADPSAWLAVPSAIGAMAARFGSWDSIRDENHHLVLLGRDVVAGALGCDPPVPDSMLGSMATLVIPSDNCGLDLGDGVDPLVERLRHEYGIEVPVQRGPRGARLIRISAQRYNEPSDYERLAAALCAELG